MLLDRVAALFRIFLVEHGWTDEDAPLPCRLGRPGEHVGPAAPMAFVLAAAMEREEERQRAARRISGDDFHVHLARELWMAEAIGAGSKSVSGSGQVPNRGDDVRQIQRHPKQGNQCPEHPAMPLMQPDSRHCGRIGAGSL